MGFFAKVAAPGTSQHLAERCRDDDCQRYGCVMYKRGYAAGWAERPPEIIIVTVPGGD
jgi:hypothetical protein